MTATVQPQSAAPLVAPNLRSRIFGFGSVFGKTIRDSRRAAIAVALFIGVPAGDRRAGDRVRVLDPRVAPGDRQPGDGRSADPAGPRRPCGQCRSTGWLHPVQVRRVLPPGHRAVVDPRPVRHARRRNPPGQHGDPRRLARDPPADRDREGRRPRRDAHAGDGVRVRRHGRRRHLRDAARRRDPGPGRVRVCRVAVAHRVGRRVACVRTGALRRPRVGRGHRRCRDVRRLPAQRLPDGDPRAGTVREPHLVRLDDQPSPARRRVRLGLAAARRGRDRRAPGHRHRGVRPP